MKKSIKLVMAVFAIMLVGTTSVFASRLTVDEFVENAGKGGDIDSLTIWFTLPDINARDSDGWTALAWAARNGRTNTVKQLIERGAAIDRKIVDNGTAIATPLYYAAREGKFDCVKVLIEAGADPNIAHTKTKMTPLQVAEDEGYSNIVKYLREHGGR